MEPAAFAAMVATIREVERALGSAEKRVTDSERTNRPIARRGVYTARDLPVGHVLAIEDLAILRPENGTSPMEVDAFVGRALAVGLPRHASLDRSALVEN